MTTSAPQWPGQEGMSEQQEEEQVTPARSEAAQPRPTRTAANRDVVDTSASRNRKPVSDLGPYGRRVSAADTATARSEQPMLQPVRDIAPRRLQEASEPEVAPPGPTEPGRTPARVRRLRPVPPTVAPDPPGPPGAVDPTGTANPTRTSNPARTANPTRMTDSARAPGPPRAPDPAGVSDPARVGDLLERRRRQQRLRRAAARRNRFVVVRDAADRDLWAARRRARASLPSPAAVTRDIALALLEVEAGCRSAAQLERIFSPQLWQALEHRIGRRGGPLPSGRSLISVRSQEHKPGLADTVAVVRKGDLVRPVALRLDACGGRWTVTELRWWRNETDTATTSGRDGGSS
jgi:Family of unknown function (DUF6459)